MLGSWKPRGGVRFPKWIFMVGLHLCSIWPSLCLCVAKQFKKEKLLNVRWKCFIFKGVFLCMCVCVLHLCCFFIHCIHSFWFVACLMITNLFLSHAGSVFNLHLVCYSGTGFCSDRRISLFRLSVLTANLWPQRVSEQETRSTVADETLSFYFSDNGYFLLSCFLFFPLKGL